MCQQEGREGREHGGHREGDDPGQDDAPHHLPLCLPGHGPPSEQRPAGHVCRGDRDTQARGPEHQHGVVMYHGAEGVWTAPRRVEGLFDLPSDPEARERWRALVPHFEYLLDDLTAEREEALRARSGPPLARLAWRVLRYGRSGELAQRLPDWVALFAQVQATSEGSEHLLVVIRYLLWVGDEAVRDAAGRVLHSVLDGQRAEALMRSYAEQLIEQGLQRGRQEGLSQGRAEDVLRILSARGVHVGEEARQRIRTCTDVALLDRWFDRALNATTLADVLDDLTQ